MRGIASSKTVGSLRYDLINTTSERVVCNNGIRGWIHQCQWPIQWEINCNRYLVLSKQNWANISTKRCKTLRRRRYRFDAALHSNPTPKTAIFFFVFFFFFKGKTNCWIGWDWLAAQFDGKTRLDDEMKCEWNSMSLSTSTEGNNTTAPHALTAQWHKRRRNAGTKKMKGC